MTETENELLVDNGDLPCGPAARHPLWPEARWNITGLFGHDLLTLQVFSVLLDMFQCHLAFDSIHGAPQVPWNSGRLTTTPIPTQAAAESLVTTFNDVGIGVYFTFTNHLLTAGDLDHAACNMLLECIDNGRGMNGVILASDLLYDYVRQRHPELKLTASIVKVTEEEGRGDVAYYRSAAERFDSVMVHPDDGFEYELLEQLDRDKTEIMVNEDCAYRCAHRARDYQMFASVMRGEVTGGEEELKRTTSRRSYCRLPQARLVPDVRCCNFTTTEMIRVYEMGFRRFKLQGRQNMPATFLFDLLRFAVEPERIAPIIFKAFVSNQAARLTGEAVTKVRQAFRERAKAGAVVADDRQPATDSATIQPMVVDASCAEGCRLPSGREAGHPCWPDASWTLEGLTENGYMFLDVIRLLADRFGYRPNISSMCEELRVPWNGWPASKGSKLNAAALADVIRHFNEFGIGVSFAFHGEITSADLDDRAGNSILAALERDSSLNGVIVVSDVLADYVRARHPKLKLAASMIKTIRENGCGRVEHYKALAERFDVVSLCPQDGFNMGLLAQLDRDRMEILVNDDGTWGSVRENSRTGVSVLTEALVARTRLRNFTTAELKRVYDLGYRRFRLKSPSKIRDIYMYDALRYILTPDLLLPVIFKSITNASELSKPRGA